MLAKPMYGNVDKTMLLYPQRPTCLTTKLHCAVYRTFYSIVHIFVKVYYFSGLEAIMGIRWYTVSSLYDTPDVSNDVDTVYNVNVIRWVIIYIHIYLYFSIFWV